MTQAISNRDTSIPKNWDRKGLPGWCYSSPALLELEKESVFKMHWQIVCHLSDIPNKGDYQTFDMCGERALIIRDRDDEVRAFYNLCRHRGSRVVGKESGNCKNAIVCPFHGWVYNLDGTLRGAARPNTFPELDKQKFGLRPINCEVWNGFVFIRFNEGPQPSVKTLLAPFEVEAAKYRMDCLAPTDGISTSMTPINWKSVRDVDNEGYHVAMAHPALQDLYGPSYYDEPYVNGIGRSHALFNPSGGRRWSVRHYLKTSEPQSFMPEELADAWLYYGIFPNAVFGFTPESVQFYQEFPLSTGETLQRSATYRYADETREQRAARYLASRIDRETTEEDVQLTIWSDESTKSEAFEGFYLSDLEYGVRTHHEHLRAILPVYTLDNSPAEEAMAEVNAKMASDRA